MQDEPLRALIVHLIGDGYLPRSINSKIMAGNGDGRPCDICGETIKSKDIEYDIETLSAEDNRVLRLHLHCHDAWKRVLND